MYRYFILIWDKLSKQATIDADELRTALGKTGHPWESIIDIPGVKVLHALSAEDSMGAFNIGPTTRVLGQLYPNPDTSDITRPLYAQADNDHIDAKSYFPSFITKWWGDYIVVSIDCDTSTLHVLKAPCGKFPCFIVKYKSLTLVFSNVNDLPVYIIRTFTINRRQLAARLLGQLPDPEQTGVNEIRQAIGGQLISFLPNSTETHWIWRADHQYRNSRITDYAEAKRALRTTLLNTVKQVATDYTSLMIWLSGGLDSTLLANAIQHVSPEKHVVCVNNFYSVTGGDERHYARLAAERAGYPLIERRIDISQTRLEVLSEQLPDPIISSYSYHLNYLHSDIEIAQTNNSEVLLSGVGGDSIFWVPRDIEVAVDCWKEVGPSSRFVNVCYNLAKHRRKTAYGVAGNAILSSLFRGSTPSTTPFLVEHNIIPKDIAARDLNTDNESFLVEIAHGLPPGKESHLEIAYTDNIFYHSQPLPGIVPIRSPFSTQPVIECCLRIPTYLLSYNGKSRELVRDCFQDLLPIEIRRKTAKGDMSQFAIALMTAHADFFRNFLADGELARHGFINRILVNDALHNNTTNNIRVLHHLHALVDVETWLRAWAAVGVTRLH